jgi:hypothetical protein
MKKKGFKISTESLSFVGGFIVGFLVAFAFSWNTIVYIIEMIMEK